jgi:hypothetical protein
MQSNLHSRLASFDVTTLDVQELENRIEMDGGPTLGAEAGVNKDGAYAKATVSWTL